VTRHDERSSARQAAWGRELFLKCEVAWAAAHYTPERQAREDLEMQTFAAAWDAAELKEYE
jgi:hypothetical protein